jgi:nucleotide-binding universal stress UspA family protein
MTQATHDTSIVVGVDYSELGDLALEKAFELSRTEEHVHLHVVHVEASAIAATYNETGQAPVIDLDAIAKRLNEYVEQRVKLWCEAKQSNAPFERLTTHVRSDRPAEAIAQLASDVEAGLVIVGTHGRRGARRFLLGSVAEGAVRLAPCAVLVVRPPNASVPVIEPPCPRCVEARRASGGKEFWCEQHREHHGRRHTHHYGGSGGTRQSGMFIHTH